MTRHLGIIKSSLPAATVIGIINDTGSHKVSMIPRLSTTSDGNSRLSWLTFGTPIGTWVIVAR